MTLVPAVLITACVAYLAVTRKDLQTHPVAGERGRNP